MTTTKRKFLLQLAAAPLFLFGLNRAKAAPVLSENNFGMTRDKARRGTGWIEIDAHQFADNISELTKVIGPKVRVCAVMKGDAYGHGVNLLVSTLLHANIHCIGLASNEEARVIRAKGFKGTLMRLRTATLEEVEDGFSYHIEEIIGNLDDAKKMAALARTKGRRLAVHFMLNSTGMDRNGLELSTNEGKRAALEMTSLKPLKIVGLMSHFPVEEEADMRQSLRRFNEETDWLIRNAELNRSALILHIANSYATLNVPESRLDMVRVGGMLFGDTDPRFTQFKKIMTYKSKVVAINPYPQGSTVCYDRTYVLSRDSWLANIPIGYSDGYRRVFSHANQPEDAKITACALIGGHRVPIVGRVTMNTLMVDVTDFKDHIQIGNDVVLYGRQGNDEITATELENIGQTILVDLTTVWGNSMPKVLKRA